MDVLWEVLPEEAVLLIDGGNIGQWFHQTLPDRYPASWLTCGASGVVGWGLPGALAAQATFPNRPVILLSGDGAMTFTIAELECASRQQLPITVIVADDQQWGIPVSGHVAAFGHPLNSVLGPTRLDQVAEGFGCIGKHAPTRDELTSAVQSSLHSNRPVLIQVPIVPSSPDPSQV